MRLRECIVLILAATPLIALSVYWPLNMVYLHGASAPAQIPAPTSTPTSAPTSAPPPTTPAPVPRAPCMLLSPTLRQCLPAAVLVGVPKASTTSLYTMLCKHPRLHCGKKKEPNFFNSHHYAEKRLEWYWDQMPRFTPLDDADTRVLDGSITTLLCPPARTRIRALLPDALLVVVEPSDPWKRIVSHYEMCVRMKREPRTLEAALRAELSRTHALLTSLTCDWERAYASKKNAAGCQHYIAGSSTRQLRALWNDTNMLVVSNSDLVATTRTIWHALGLDVVGDGGGATLGARAVVEEHRNAAKSTGKRRAGDTVSNATRARVEAALRDDQSFTRLWAAVM